MKKIILLVLLASSLTTINILVANTQLINTDLALKAANNWISLIIEKKGSWGGLEYAEIEEIMDLTREGKKIGYYCKVYPRGFIIVSLRKELAPIKAYSATTCINPDSDEGLPDLLKGKMAKIVDTLEKQLGSLAQIKSSEMNNFLETNHISVWDELIGRNGKISTEAFQSGINTMNYGGGEILLKTSWGQGDPYNGRTPAGDACDHTPVGCTAVAIAQVMNFWSWPPYGIESPFDDPYDWPNMLDVYISGNTYTSAQINAITELSYEAGQALESDYGCDGTTAYSWCSTCTDVEDVLEDYFRYSGYIDPEHRDAYSTQEWFDMIVGQINSNQPMVYSIPNHSIVCDGWQEIGTTKQYHMNYGWGLNNEPCIDNDGQQDCNAWYTIDELYMGSYDDELMQIHIRPAQSLNSDLRGNYTVESFPYRYFNVDAVGVGVNFEGQFLQFLPTVKVTGGAGSGAQIRFEGTSNAHSRLFSKGNVYNGILIRNGAIRLYENGGIRFP